MMLHSIHMMVLLSLVFSFSGCARAPLQNSENAMRKVSSPRLQDDLPLEPLFKAVEEEIQFLDKAPSSLEFVFGKEQFSKEDYLLGLKRFLELGQGAQSPEGFFSQVEAEFDFYEVYGQSHWGEVFITSYFEPVILGSLKRTEKYSSPLYRTPSDLATADLSLFDSKCEKGKRLKGRLEGNRFLPYYTRDEIDTKKALDGKKLEICWVDPIDAFFLHIQGSGTVDLGKNKFFYVNYAEQNGHAYEAVGKFLKSYIPSEQLNLFTIESFLRSIPQREAQMYLSKNPSYVFFKTSDQRAITYLGVPAIAGRTIATDKRYFPKGALAFLSFQKPVFNSSGDPIPVSFQSSSRIVLDQDIGGAINGGGRVDLFWGRGEESKKNAGVMKGSGTLYYIAPKRR